MGKTSLILKLYDYCRGKGLKPAGIITQEVRERGQRIGFKLKDLASGTEGWLAKTDKGNGPRIGKYTVISEDLERIGVRALENSASGDAKVVFVDEIGPMELTSKGFRRAISELLRSDKIVVATLKYGSHYEEVDGALKQGLAEKVELTRENRDAVLEQIISKTDNWLSKV